MDAEFEELQRQNTWVLVPPPSNRFPIGWELIHRAGVDSCTTAPMPISPSRSTNGADVPFHNPRLFRSLVGGLQYLTVTRPDIQFTVNYVAQKMHSPTEQDFHTLKRILRDGYQNPPRRLNIELYPLQPRKSCGSPTF
uniref:Reverse transcriptase Ty1/copia-type domain-containing protein n=1 Tax=Solanum lycopersicum TaxID=4081 RepID=A0A3Q7G000_SOLLC